MAFGSESATGSVPYYDLDRAPYALAVLGSNFSIGASTNPILATTIHPGASYLAVATLDWTAGTSAYFAVATLAINGTDISGSNYATIYMNTSSNNPPNQNRRTTTIAALTGYRSAYDNIQLRGTYLGGGGYVVAYAGWTTLAVYNLGS